jgi:1-acyl-sn-glycerol-3-phosphate acyltransferase
MSHVVSDIVYTGVKILAWSSFHSYFRLRTFGVEEAPRRGPLLVASNHVSGLDPIIIGVGLRQRVYFLARETLLRGFWGWLMQVAGARPIRRDSADRTAIGLALELLGRGDTVVMFPEGTRSRTGEVQEVRHGIGMIAARANCPVLPVYIAGARELLPQGRNLPKPGRLALFAGTVLSPDSIPRSENARDHYAEIAGRVHAALAELEARARKNGWIDHPS